MIYGSGEHINIGAQSVRRRTLYTYGFRRRPTEPRTLWARVGRVAEYDRVGFLFVLIYGRKNPTSTARVCVCVYIFTNIIYYYNTRRSRNDK